MGARLASLLLLPGLLTACDREPEPDRHRIAAFGTEVVVTIRARSGADVPAAVAAVDREFQQWHRRWHAWEPGMLGDINEAIAAGRRIAISAQTAAIIEQAAELERQSGGLFNPAIGQLLSLWGFHSSELPEGPPPSAAAIERLVAASPSMADLSISGGTLASDNSAVQLDFGAFVKGVAIERALELLANAGIEHAIVNAGGDLGVIGRQNGRPWRAAVQHPDGEGGRYLAELDVYDGEFVFTSGNYRRYRQGEGIRHGHILDPRDGYPADGVRSVTVIDERGGKADAAATALAVAEPEEWRRVASELGIDRVMRVEADGRIRITPAMAERTHWRDHSGNVRVSSLP